MLTEKHDASTQTQRSVAAPDHFVVHDGAAYAGTHILVDLWGATRLDDRAHVEAALVRATNESGATLLHIHLHQFSPSGGISGVAVLAESHISVHTWPERGFAALDVFMCGATEPARAVEALRAALQPDRIDVRTMMRGKVGADG